MKPFKLKVTRPEFLLLLMGGHVGSLNMTNMRKTMYDTTALSYCAYTVLMDADVDPDDIETAHNDGESIALAFYSKRKAKEVKNLCNKETVRYGNHLYTMHLKVRDRYLIAEIDGVKEISPQQDEASEEDEGAVEPT